MFRLPQLRILRPMVLVTAVVLAAADPVRGQTVLFTADTDSSGGTNSIGAPANSNNGDLPPLGAGVTLAPNPARFGGVLTGPLGGISYGPGVAAGGGSKGGTTGFVTVSYTFTAGGNAQLTWEVSDVVDYDFDSALVIDNVRRNGTLLFGFESGFPAGFIPSGSAGTSGAVANLAPREGTKFAYLDTLGSETPIFDTYDGTGGSRLVSSVFAVAAGDVLTMDLAFLTNDGGTPAYHDYGAAMVAFVSSVCGNGTVDPGEDCDDGNNTNGDCCSAACLFESSGDPCEIDGNLCTSDQCDGNGTCRFVENITCFPAIPPCEGGETCNPQLGCVASPDAPSTTACNSDGNLCTIDHCNGSGSCVLGSNVQCAPPVPPCEAGSACVPQTGNCASLPDAPTTTSCNADASVCTIDHCNGHGICVFGSNLSCAAANPPCEAGETCNAQLGCMPLADAPPGTLCDADGTACTTDQCDGAGSCVFVEGNPDACIDHYLCYKARTSTRFTSDLVHLADQFETGTAKVLKPKDLCVPADKQQEGIPDPFTHEQAFTIKMADAHVRRRNIHIANQFGSLSVDTIKPDRLFAPANQDPLVVPPAPAVGLADYYKCYKVRVTPGTPPFVARDVTVADEFATRTYSVTKVRHLCLPVDKDSEGIVHALPELTCYRAKMARGQTLPARQTVNVNSSFGPQVLETVLAYELCVPSQEVP